MLLNKTSSSDEILIVCSATPLIEILAKRFWTTSKIHMTNFLSANPDRFSAQYEIARMDTLTETITTILYSNGHSDGSELCDRILNLFKPINMKAYTANN